jgi:uncharacterized membrane protein
MPNTSVRARANRIGQFRCVRKRKCSSARRCCQSQGLKSGRLKDSQKLLDQPKGYVKYLRRALRHPDRLALFFLVSAATLLALPEIAQASLAEALAKNFRDIAHDWVVIVSLAALPVVELRGAIPVGIVVLEQHPVLVFLLSAIGNMLPVPLVLVSLGPLRQALGGIRPLARTLDSILSRARRQASEFKSEHVFWALVLFVGVPLPGTGAWSGAIVSYVLGLPFWTAMAANGMGVLIAGILVTVLSCMGFAGFVSAVIVISMFPLVSWMTRNLAQDPRS